MGIGVSVLLGVLLWLPAQVGALDPFKGYNDRHGHQAGGPTRPCTPPRRAAATGPHAAPTTTTGASAARAPTS